MTDTEMKFDSEPEDVEATISIYFDGTAEDEAEAGEVISYWERDAKTMVMDLEYEVRTALKVQHLTPVFMAYYNDQDNEDGFFNALEQGLNEAGFYTYQSGTRFEVYHPSLIDTDKPEIAECLAEPPTTMLRIVKHGTEGYNLRKSAVHQ